MVFRQTNFLKQEVRVEKELKPNLRPEELRIRDLTVQKTTVFKKGLYFTLAGVVLTIALLFI